MHSKSPASPGLMMVTTLALVLAACGGPAASAEVSSVDTVSPTAVSATRVPAQPAATQPAVDVTLPVGDVTQPPPATATAAPAASAASGKINLNTATADEFLTIPNVGNRMVREFMEYRPYVSIEQFRHEIGKYVTADQVVAYEQSVYVPVDVNQADAATLQQLPGVTAAIAADLIAGRPYADSAAFLAKLGQAVSADELAAAPAYLTTP